MTEARDAHGRWSRAASAEAVVGHLEKAEAAKASGDRLGRHVHAGHALVHAAKLALSRGDRTSAQQHALKLTKVAGALRSMAHHAEGKGDTVRSEKASIRAMQMGRHARAVREALKTGDHELIKTPVG